MPHVNAGNPPFPGDGYAIDERCRRRAGQMTARRRDMGGLAVVAFGALVLGSPASPAQAQTHPPTPAAAPAPTPAPAPAPAPAPGDQQQQQVGAAPAPTPAYPPPPGYQATPPDAAPGASPPTPGYPTPAPDYNQPPSGYGTAPAPYPPPPPRYGTPGPGYQQPGYPAPYAYVPPAPNEHDGFYLRLHIGLGFTRIRSSGTSVIGDQEFSGGSASFGIALGAVVAPNLILYGAMFGSSVADPNVKVNGTKVDQGQSSADVFGFGAGVAYYFQPMNVYIAGTVSTMQLSLSDSNDDTMVRSKWGVGFQGLVGKEWWFSREWGLGIAGEVMGANMKDKYESGVTWRAASFAVLFSATYN